MKILVLGGTKFVGRHFVEIAIKCGHDVTLFNRGNTNLDLFPEVSKIKGDRLKEIDKITDNYDIVLDTSGYFPENLKYVTSHLKNKVGKYIFISSCSVYDHTNQDLESFTESDGTLVNLNIDHTDDTPETYGARKYLCEQEVKKVFPGKHLILRPGLIVGPFDPTYRFPYWADRVSEGGDVLAPGEKDAPLQFIDVRDLVEWTLRVAEEDLTGTYNLTTPHQNLNLEKFLNLTVKTINPNAKLKWVSEKKLRDNDVTCWKMLPLWVYKEIQGFLKVDSSLAIKQGLTFRPIENTILETFKWSKDIYKAEFANEALSRSKEAKILSST